MPELGDVIDGKYRLVHLLGQGGMGSVYEAEHIQIAKKIAVKFLKTELLQEAEYTQRFIREARAASATGHKSIVDIHDIGQSAEGDLYLVMELLEGESLADLLDKQPMLGVSQAAYITAHILSALAAAHEHGIVHRDIKPENTFLEYTGQTWPEVKLLDFGASKIAEVAGPQAGRLTATGIVLGTPYYMSPEQAKGLLDVDHRADLYAVGVLLYETLTGRLPFSGANYNQVMAAVLSEPFDTPRTINPSLPEELERVVLRAMMRDRSQRYQSASQMLQDLLPFVEEKATATIAIPRGVSLLGASYMSAEGSSGLTPPLPADVSGSIVVPRGDFTTTVHRGIPVWAVIAGTALFVAAIAVGATLFMVWLGVNDRAAEAPQPEVLPTKTIPVTPVPDLDNATLSPNPGVPEVVLPPGDASVTVVSEDIEITLSGLPPNAAVFLGDAPVEGHVLRMRRGGGEIEVRVELAGHRPWRRVLSSPEESSTIDVVLEPDEDAIAKNGKRRDHRRDRSQKRDRNNRGHKGGNSPLKGNPFDY